MPDQILRRVAYQKLEQSKEKMFTSGYSLLCLMGFYLAEIIFMEN